MGVVIRPATRDDVDGLLAFDMTVVVRTRDDWTGLIDKALRGERLLLVAEVAGEIAAFGQAHHLDEHAVDHAPAGWFLTGVTVLPHHRRQGLGASLTTARLDWIAQRSDSAWYFAAADNVASIRLHTELGFVEVSRAPSIHGVSFAGGEGVLFRRSLES
ncbi:MAG: GNAT family N-acetyltransferase [Aeromicrobium sp.]